MRNPKRIPKVLDRLKKIWEKNPDLRLSQLIGNVYRDSSGYYEEDGDFINNLEKFYGD